MSEPSTPRAVFKADEAEPLRGIVDNPDEYAGGDQGQRYNEENEQSRP
jgi:hypothetical protein